MSNPDVRQVLVTDPQSLPLKEPSTYQIRIQGLLDENWGDYFGGEIEVTQEEDDPTPKTTLRTPPIDQPELVGLVNRLNGLGLRLLLVEQVYVEGDIHSQ